MNPLKELLSAGQSVWYDNIERRLLSGGLLERMVAEDGLRGVTSNPAIFEKAINGSVDYDYSIRRLLEKTPGISPRELFFELAIEDIRAAADTLRPVYDSSQGCDGMVSLEVSPDLAYKTGRTVEEARDLWKRVSRPNVMIKVPGTVEGVEAVEILTSEGININVTLLFSVDRYIDIAHAYIRGLQTRLEAGLSISHISSVASFFVSRVDSEIDRLLDESNNQLAVDALRGKVAIANAKVAYGEFQKIFESGAFSSLKDAGAVPQRLLWASTGTKDPDYSDVLYVESLIGPHTVNTIPPSTYEAFRQHGTVSPTLAYGLPEARAQIEALAAFGIDLSGVTENLEIQGLDGFLQAFDALLAAIESKIEETANA